MLDQSEVGHLDSVADQEQVAWLDVEMLQVVLAVHVVERLGRVAQIAKQVIARNADHAGRLALSIEIVQRAVGQFHDDDQFATDDLDAVEGAYEWVANFLDAIEGLEFLLGADAVHIYGVEVTVDKLHCLADTARRLALPDFAEAPAAEGFNQAVSAYRLGVGFPQPIHGAILREMGKGSIYASVGHG